MWERHRATLPCPVPFETTICGLSRAGLGLSHVDCRAPLHIDIGPVGGTYYLHLPLDGEVLHVINGQAATCGGRTAVLQSPGQAVRMEATAVRTLIVSLDRTLLEDVFLSGGLPCHGIDRWGRTIDLESRNGHRLANTCLMAARELDRADSPILLEKPFENLKAEVRGCLAATLSDIAPAWKPTHGAWLGICSIDDLADWLRANIDKPLGLADLIARSGVSARAVQKAFVRYFGCGPHRFIRNLKLEEAQRRIANRPYAPLLGLARELGFYHPGRFAAEYFARFGEYPSDTRARWID